MEKCFKPPTQRVVRGYFREAMNSGRLCGDGVPTLLSGMEMVIIVLWFSGILLEFHGAFAPCPILRTGPGSTNQPRITKLNSLNFNQTFYLNPRFALLWFGHKDSMVV